MFDTQTVREIAAVAKELDLDAATLLAVAEVESGGKAFAVVNGRPEPLIRFEGHYFDRRLSGDRRAAARKAGLASPLAGGVPNPRTQAARWALLARASAIDRKAAYESVSWGIGQVMGAHWAWLGYTSVDAMVSEARGSVAGQVRLMTKYIEKAGLRPALLKADWHAFARGYNGPAYKRHGYHTKLAAARKRHAARLPSMTAAQVARAPEPIQSTVKPVASAQPAARPAPPATRSEGPSAIGRMFASFARLFTARKH